VADNRTVSADLLRDGQEQRGYFPCEVLHAVGDLGLMGMLVNGGVWRQQRPSGRLRRGH
jgi:hypothetical protein